MKLFDCAREIIDTWQLAINESRELSNQEIDYILSLQAKVIEEQILENDGLTDEELQYENQANNHFKFKGKMEA